MKELGKIAKTAYTLYHPFVGLTNYSNVPGSTLYYALSLTAIANDLANMLNADEINIATYGALLHGLHKKGLLAKIREIVVKVLESEGLSKQEIDDIMLMASKGVENPWFTAKYPAASVSVWLANKIVNMRTLETEKLRQGTLSEEQQKLLSKLRFDVIISTIPQTMLSASLYRRILRAILRKHKVVPIMAMGGLLLISSEELEVDLDSVLDEMKEWAYHERVSIYRELCGRLDTDACILASESLEKYYMYECASLDKFIYATFKVISKEKRCDDEYLDGLDMALLIRNAHFSEYLNYMLQFYYTMPTHYYTAYALYDLWRRALEEPHKRDILENWDEYVELANDWFADVEINSDYDEIVDPSHNAGVMYYYAKTVEEEKQDYAFAKNVDDFANAILATGLYPVKFARLGHDISISYNKLMFPVYPFYDYNVINNSERTPLIVSFLAMLPKLATNVNEVLNILNHSVITYRDVLTKYDYGRKLLEAYNKFKENPSTIYKHIT